MYFLCYSTDTLDNAGAYRTKAAALEAFRTTARELAHYGQSCEASLHQASSRDTVAEYPDWALSLSESGRVLCDPA